MLFQKGQHPSLNTEFQKGQIPWNKGLKGLQDWHNISGLNKGIPWNKGLKGLFKHSKATREKISKNSAKYWLGKKHPHSEETKRKMSKTRKGKLPKHHFEKGYKQTEETKRKISEAHLGKPCPWNKREKHPNWKGGVTSANHLLRASAQFRLWRESVFIRDNYTCQKCKIKSGCGYKIYLHPHHIQNFADYPKLRFAIDNGITLCKKCHREFHKIYGVRYTTKEQIMDYLKARYLITQAGIGGDSKSLTW